MKFGRGLLRGGVIVLLIKLLNVGLGFLLAIFLARNLGAAGYGVYAVAYAIISLVAIPIKLGLPQVVVRETAKARINSDWRTIKGLWRWASCISLGIMSAIFIVGAPLTFIFYSFNTFDDYLLILSAIVIIPMMALGTMRGAALRGMKRIIQGLLPDLVVRPTLFLVLVIIILLGSAFELSPGLVMALHALAAAVAFVVGLVLLSRALPEGFAQVIPDKSGARMWIASALPLALAAGMNFGNQYADLIIVGVLMPAEAAGVYRVVLQIGALMIIGQTAINAYISPIIVQRYAKGGNEALVDIIRFGAWLSFGFAALSYLVFVIGGERLLSFLFGEEYTAGYAPFVVLGVGQLMNAGMGALAIVLSMTGHERLAAKSAAFACLINIALNLVLVPLIGILGAALSTAISLFLWNIMLKYQVERSLGIRVGFLGL